MQIGNRSRFRQFDMPPARHRAGAAADKDVGQRVSVVPVAVGHVRAVHEERVVEQRPLAVGNRGHLADKIGKALHVPGLDPNQFLDSSQIVGMMRHRVERIGNADVVVRAVGAFGDHEVRSHARQIGLIGQRDQVEEQPDLLVERVQFADRRLGQIDARQVALRCQLDAPFDFPNRLQIAFQNDTVARVQIALQCPRAVVDAVQKAHGLRGNGFPLLGCVAFTEQLDKDLARIEFHRQRRVGVAERKRGTVIAPGTAARCHLAGGFGSQFQGRQRSVLADLAGDHLVERGGHAGPRRVVIRPDAAQPGRGRQAVHPAHHGLVFQIAE